MKKLLFGGALIAMLGASSVFLNCSSDPNPLVACVNDHESMEHLSEVDAIGECLSDELHKNFSTQAECESFVTGNGGYAASKTAGCMKYFVNIMPVVDAAVDGAAHD